MIDWNALVAEKGVRPQDGQTRFPAKHEAWGHKPEVSMSAEFRRIRDLPRRALELDGTERAEAIIDTVTERFARPSIVGRKCRCAELDPDRHREEGCITRLRLVQALALREIGICGGLLGVVGTGHGKTNLDLLAPLAFRVFDPKMSTIVLLIPPSLVGQLIRDYQYVGQHFKMSQLVVHGTPYSNTCQKMDPLVPLDRGAPCMHVVPYSRLSRPESTVWLERDLKPDAVVADECHRLRSLKTATGARVYRYMEEIAPHTKFACWSGSITARSLQDYAHLSKWALRGGSPLPTNENDVADWCRALDPQDNPAEPGPLLELCDPGEQLLDGFRRRLVETIGVASTSAPPVDCALTLRERKAPPMPEAVRNALKMVRGELPDQSGPQRPDGEELVDALSMARVAMQVACGFYYKWIYPRCEFPRDTQLVLAWLKARKEWLCEVRAKLKSPEEHMDSPRLVQNAAERAWGDRPYLKGLPAWRALAWPDWRDIRSKVFVDTQTVEIDDFLVRDAIVWAKENNGVVWYEHGAVGEWMARLSGLPLFGGGKDAKVALLGDPERGIRGEDGSRSIICSIKAHGTGTNGLQHRFSKAHLLNPMSDPTGWEQVLARLVRIGQKAPEVVVDYYAHTPEIRDHLTRALRAALYVEGSLGSKQKIVGTLKI